MLREHELGGQLRLSCGVPAAWRSACRRDALTKFWPSGTRRALWSSTVAATVAIDPAKYARKNS